MCDERSESDRPAEAVAHIAPSWVALSLVSSNVCRLLLVVSLLEPVIGKRSLGSFHIVFEACLACKGLSGGLSMPSATLRAALLQLLQDCNPSCLHDCSPIFCPCKFRQDVTGPAGFGSGSPLCCRTSMCTVVQNHSTKQHRTIGHQHAARQAGHVTPDVS